MANKDFKKAIKLDPEDRGTYFFRSKMYHMMSDFINERNDILKTIELDSEDPEGYYYLAKSYISQKKYFKAIGYIDKSINRLLADKGYYISDFNGFGRVKISQLYIMKAEIYSHVSEKDLACEEYQKACESGDCLPFEEFCSK